MSFCRKAPKVLILLCLASLLILPAAWGFEPLALDDGTAESGVTKTSDYTLFLNRFTPETGGYLLGGAQFQLYSGPTTSVDVFVWEDDNNDPTDGATLVASVKDIQASGGQWTTVELDSPVWVDSDKDVLIGIFSNRTLLSKDQNTSQQRSYWAGFSDGSFADDPTLPPDSPTYPLELLDNFTSGNFLIRGNPFYGPWDPQPADGTTEVSEDVTLSWETTDDIQTCDLYFGESGDMVLVAIDLASPDLEWTPESLEPHVTYQWRVIGHTASGDTSGDVWNFTTTFEPEIEEAGLEDFVLASPDLSGTLSPDIYVVLDGSDAGRVDLNGIEEALAGVSFDIECLAEVSEGQMAVLPLTVTFRLTSSDLGQDLYDRIGVEASADYSLLDEAMLDNLTFTKTFTDGTTYDLFDVALEAASGDAYKFFAASADEDCYTMILDIAVVDGEAASGDAVVQAITDSEDHFFLIFDGQRDSRFSDPLVVTDAEDGSGSGSGGTCNIGFSPAFALLFLPLLGLLKKR